MARSSAYAKRLPEPDLVYVVDFFAGCGGMSWGFANTRQSHLAFKVLAGVDINQEALDTYRVNVGAPGVVADIRELARTPQILGELIPELQATAIRPLVFIGCPPCQGFSAHRKKDDRDDVRNNLLGAFATLVEHYRPDVVVIENVPEMLSGRFDRYYNGAAERLSKAGYVLNAAVLDLSRYAVPQRRRRAIVLGHLDHRIEMPEPLLSRDAVRTVRDAIAHLSPVDSGRSDPNDLWHRAPAHIERILERIRKTPIDGGDRRSLSDEDQLECHRGVDNSSTPGFTDVYGRLRWDQPSVTITAKSSTPSCGRFLHPEQHRNITVREAALLQGFPHDYQFQGSFVNQYRQIGEAVPPLFARSLAWTVLDALRPVPTSRAVLPDRFGGPQPVVVDAFCGAGGIAIGFESAGFECVFAFDTDRDAVATFNSNIAPTARVRDVRDKALPEEIGAAVGDRPYVLVGGPPCQGFSQQRRGDNDDPRNDLILAYASLLRKLPVRPLAVVLENVTYLDSPRGRGILARYLRVLARANYATFRYDLNSADFGVAQLRHRIVIVGVDRTIAHWYTGIQTTRSERWTTVGEELAGLEDPDKVRAFSVVDPHHTTSRESAINRRRVAFVDMGKGRLAIPEELQLPCHRRYGGHLDVFGRLDWFAQARTITGGFDSYSRGEYVHPLSHRSITHRETARIQGFPDRYQFTGNKAAVRHQIGNAVPPPLARAVAVSLRNAYEAWRPVVEWATS